VLGKNFTSTVMCTISLHMYAWQYSSVLTALYIHDKAGWFTGHRQTKRPSAVFHAVLGMVRFLGELRKAVAQHRLLNFKSLLVWVVYLQHELLKDARLV